jgi:serine/threonine-protein kinase
MSESPDLSALADRVIADRYRLEWICGKGGFGVVYRAKQLVLGQPVRTVAVKLLKTSAESWAEVRECLNDALMVLKLIEEGGAAEQVRHIVSVLDLGIESSLSNAPYVVMEFLNGDLSREIEGPDSQGFQVESSVGVGVKKAFRYVEEALLGLSLLHEGGVIHRDIKPENLLRDGQDAVRVADFGLAVEGSLAEAHGTVAYLAPESLSTRRTSPATDVWAIGVTAWELLVGRRLFQSRLGGMAGDEALRRLEVLQREPRQPLHELVPELGEGDGRIAWVEQCLAEPLERYPDAPAALIGLRAALTGHQGDRPRRRGRAQILEQAQGLLKQEQYALVLEEMQEFLRQNPGDNAARVLAAKALTGLSRTKEAIKLLRERVAKEPSRDLLLELATCFEHDHNPTAARVFRRRASGAQS